MENNSLKLDEYPRELQKAYNDADGDIMWRAGIARAATILLLQEKKEAREAFEAEYSSGDTLSDSISLARDSNGEYEQALARLSFKWFLRGYQSATQKWEPIDTAPKDGTHILAYTYVNETIDMAYFDGERWNTETLFISPTHWMPLPPAPSPEQKGGE